MALMVVASLTMALLAMASTATGSIQVGKCGDLSAFPGICAADVCQFRCGVMGGDREKAYCDAAGKCCCPPGAATLCRPLDGCRNRIPACRIKCKSVFRDPARAFCQDGSPGFGDSCCCSPNNVVASTAFELQHHLH
uniref:Uncharacterized protein n=1 Tax=Oryza punctata TaxID=4537 RepID=A0A0E0MD86_ORYPU